MVSRIVARSRLRGLARNSGVFHVASASAAEDSEQYFQMARLRSVFSIETATGSDLDERAREIMPAVLRRRAPLRATTNQLFTRVGTTGTTIIPTGSQVGAEDAEGVIIFRTTAPGSITPGNTVSAPIPVVAQLAGVRGNVDAGAISRLLSRIPGVVSTTNAAVVITGQSRESDQSFRARLRSFIQSLSRGTPTAIESFSASVQTPDGRRVLHAKVVEPILPNGTTTVYIDNGTGATDVLDITYQSADDTVLTAVGGEIEVFSTLNPIRNFIEVRVNNALQVQDVDFSLDVTRGRVRFSSASYPLGLTTGDVVTMRYVSYGGLIEAVNEVVNGNPSDAIRFPGVRAAGIQTFVLPAIAVPQTLQGVISARDGYNVVTLAALVASTIQEYINSLGIGAPVIVAEIVERAMGVPGMYNFKILSLTGGAAIDQVVQAYQVPRIQSSDISLI